MAKEKEYLRYDEFIVTDALQTDINLFFTIINDRQFVKLTLSSSSFIYLPLYLQKKIYKKNKINNNNNNDFRLLGFFNWVDNVNWPP